MALFGVSVMAEIDWPPGPPRRLDRFIERCHWNRCVRTRRRGRLLVDRPTTSTEVVVGQSLWAGVDAGKADHYCVVIDADEQRLELPLKSWRVLYVTGLPGVILA